MAIQLLDRLPRDLPERRVFDNGMVLVHREDFSGELLSLQLWVKTGSIHEGRSLGAGLSHYLEHLLFKGTEKFGPGEIAREVQAAGGYVNAYTTFDRTVYYIDLPSESLDRGLEILADMAFRAKLETADIEAERSVILREIDMGLDDPDRQLAQSLFGTAFRCHPYRHPIIGHRPLFEAVEADDLRAYYRSRYVPNNIGLMVAGAVDAEDMAEAVQRAFGGQVPRCLDDVVFAAEPPQLSRRHCPLRGEVQVCRGSLAYRIPSLTDPDAPALDMLANLLGGGHSARLWKVLREERRLVHHIEASAWNPGTSGLLWVSYVADPGREEAIESAVVEVICDVAANGVAERELDKAKAHALAGEINARKRVRGQAARLGTAEIVVGDLNYPLQYFRHLEALTPDAIGRVAGRYLREDQLTSVVLGPKAADGSGARVKPAKPAPARFESVELSNGARVLFQVDRRLPKVNLRFSALGGPVYEEADKRGVTGLLATLLTRDTAKRTAAEVSDAVETVGGGILEFSGNNSFGFGLEVMRGDEALALDLFEEALLAPAFDETTLERERDAQVSHIQEMEDEIVEFGQKALRRHFFGRHPLAEDPLGRPETVAALCRADVLAAYRHLVAGPNTVLSVCGDFDPGWLLPRVETVAAGAPGWAFPRRAPPRPQPAAGELIREVLPREQAVLFLGFPDAGVGGDDFILGEVLQEILSDMSGRLFLRVREEQGLAYFVGASRIVGVDTGLFFLYGGTHPESGDTLLAELEAEARRVAEGGLTAAERDRAVRRLKARKRMSLQGIGARAAQASLNALFGLPVNDWLDYDDRVDAVDLDRLRDFAVRRFRADEGVRLRVSPE